MKYTVEEVNKVALMRHLWKIQIGTYPSWVNESRTEGIELKNGELTPFWIKDGSRIYNEPPSNKIELILKELSPPVNTATTEDISKIDRTVMVPERITEPLLKKWKEMTTFMRLLLFQETAPEYVKKKPKGKKLVSYVEGNLMVQEANITFLFQWNDSIQGFHISKDSVACYGSVSAKIDDETVTHSAVGIDNQEYTKDKQEPVFTEPELMKNAHMDMIKKALSKFGFNNDVYRGDI